MLEVKPPTSSLRDDNTEWAHEGSLSTDPLTILQRATYVPREIVSKGYCLVGSRERKETTILTRANLVSFFAFKKSHNFYSIII